MTHAPAQVSESLDHLAEAVDRAFQEVRTLDEPARAHAINLRNAIEAFHKAGLMTIVRHLKQDQRGLELLMELVKDPLIYAMFTMHGIVRADLTTQAMRVIEAVRPYMQSHGGDVELVEVRDGTAFVRLHGACNGCSMSAVTLRDGVEEALKANIPEITQVEVLPNEPGPALIAPSAIGVVRKESGWIKGPSVAELATNPLYRLDTDATSILIVQHNNQLSAFRNACAHQGLPLDGGLLDAETGTLTCPWHGFCYDGLSGECLTAPAAQLEPFPLRVEDGVVWVRPS